MRLVTHTRPRMPRRGGWTLRLRRIGPLIAIGGVAALILAGAGAFSLLWRSGLAAAELAHLRAAVIARSAGVGMTVDSVLVQGRQETPPAAVLQALGVARGQPLLAFDPLAAKERLERLGWVREAAVERRFPGTIAVRLVERRPLALWQRDGKLALVDDTGTVIGGDDIDRFADFPIIVGDDAPRHAPALLAMLAAEPQLKAHVSAAVWISGRRWDLHFDNGIGVRLPEQHPEAALTRLADLDRATGLLKRDLVAIDLRLSDRLILKLSPAAARRLREPGADT